MDGPGLEALIAAAKQKGSNMRTLYAVAAMASLAGLSQANAAEGVILPWGQRSDMVAWEVFAQVTAPSGQANKVEFETWASDEDIYQKNPAQWPTISEPKSLRMSALAEAHTGGPVVRPFAFQPGACIPPSGLAPPNGDGAAAGSGFPTDGCIGEEVRRNWASFQYIVSHALDSKVGRSRAFASGLQVDLPADAIEVKGDWASVGDVAKWLNVDASVVRKHYYVSTSQINGVNTEIALLSFHFSTKQVKNWVWSDFEGTLNPGRCDDIGCHDSFGAVVADVEPHDKPYTSYGECAKNSRLRAMLSSAGVDPVWLNYCLKGTQVTYLDDNGAPILLGNSVIEPLNAGVPIKVSSCVTCHAYASFDKDGKPNFAPLQHPLQSPIGNVDPNLMKGFAGNDFIWGIVTGGK
jgi:hypothetical protein